MGELLTWTLSGELERFTRGVLPAAFMVEESFFVDDATDFTLVALVRRVGAAGSVGVFVRERVLGLAFITTTVVSILGCRWCK